MSLVEKAMSMPRSDKARKDDDEVIRLAVAWATGVVTDSQVAAVTQTTVPNVASKVARILKRAIDSGRVRVEILR